DGTLLWLERIEDRLLIRAVIAVTEHHEPSGARVGERGRAVGQPHVAIAELPQHVRGELGLGGDRVGIGDVESKHALTACAFGAGQHGVPGRVARKLHVRGLRRAVYVEEVARIVIRVDEVDEIGEYAVRDVGEALLSGRRIDGVQHAVVRADVDDRLTGRVCG